MAQSNGGVTLVELIGVVFIVLKLCKVINWPWIWVLAPLWGGFICIILIIILITWLDSKYPWWRLMK